MLLKGKIMIAVLLSLIIFCGCTGKNESQIVDKTENTTETEGTELKTYWQDLKNFGINIAEDGTMMLAGKSLYSAGVNCYDLFNQCFSDGYSVKKAKEALDILASYHVNVVRFNCGGYSYSFIDDYYENQKAYLDLLREIADYAERLQIGLIPSFFWLSNAVPDYYDEPIRCWGRSDSMTIRFLRAYTKEIVSALKDSKAIFAWEFGNEFNLNCDLPNAAEHMPALPSGSSRSKRTEEDYLSANDVNYALSEFAKEILSIDDSGRMILSGNATLRPSQYNQLMYGTWEQDSLSEYETITAMFAPNGIEAISEHVYFLSQKTFGKNLSLSEYLQYATNTAKKLKKAYFVGEWGGGDSTDYEYYRTIGNAFVDAGVQLVLLWNFNAEEGRIEYSFSADTERGRELLKIVGEMNARYASEF